ncbi:MAG: hypothetical protein ACHQJ4_03325 [Ignavibacteria bacterium]
MEPINNTIKYIIKTDNDKTYSLYIMEASEYIKGKYIALFLYYDDDDFDNTEKLWLNIRHRILFENSIEAIKSKIIEYADGRNEKLMFLQIQESLFN